MASLRHISRRQFISTAATSSAASVLATPALSFAFGDAARVRGAFDLGGATSALMAWQDQGVINVANSPYAKLHSVPVHAVTIEEGFWSKRRKTNVERSIPTMREELEEHGRMDNFRRLVGKSKEPQKGPYFSDSDIYKWVDAVGWALQSDAMPELRRTTDSMIREVVAAQEPNGYLNTYYQNDRISLRMSQHDQEVGHEMYCLGHMLQGAIAYYRGTGDSTLMDAGVRMIDNFVLPNYGPGPNQKPIISGHPEIEMALIELYRTTGKRQYVELAGYILHGDPRANLTRRTIVYTFCGIPFTDRTKLEGHAVRAMYACCGATDYYMETGDGSYWNTLEKLWNDMSDTKMYVTGGVGSRSDGEAFGDAYELPNFRAYGESCAAIGNMMWSWRMLAATGDGKFTDVIERALYNGINSGMSLDGTTYCYRNPLAFDPSTGDKIRNPWYDTTCCPPNLERIFGSLPGYFYSTRNDGIYVHLYDNSELDWHLENGTRLKVTQKTDYPWDGNVEIAVTPAQPADFVFYLRIPGWAEKAQVAVNGKSFPGAKPGEYLAIRRRWSAGDRIHLLAEMTPQVLEANPRVADDTGRVAVQRGPLVYCLEELDQPSGVDLSNVAIEVGKQPESEFQSEMKTDLLGGVLLLRHPGVSYERNASASTLYPRYTGATARTARVPLSFIPYYAWANRQATAMQVWT